MKTEKQVQFPVLGANGALFAAERAAQEGMLNFAKPVVLEYRFENSSFAKDSSIQFSYDFSFSPSQALREKTSIIINAGASTWELPMGIDNDIQYYIIPLDSSFDGYFNITLVQNDKIDKRSAPVFNLRAVKIVPRWFGFTAEWSYTPFLDRNNSGYIISVPPSFLPDPLYVGIEAEIEGITVLETAGRRIETFPGTRNISFSADLFAAEGKAILSGDAIKTFKFFTNNAPSAFPRPITADPALVINWPRDNWRNAGYEVFSWDHFSRTGNQAPVLIFDFSNYNVQDRMLRRLAFFVEKAGFRGRLAHDSEIEGLHAWNAHDYRAEDLARFFDAARGSNFPLLDEELQLERILLNEKIIVEDNGGIAAGSGAIISIARESAEYLRYQFMAHEGFHGLFFIDEEFREFSRRRWEQFPIMAKRFLTSYFEFQQYDVKDEYLLINEFMAHLLQQSVSGAAEYFGKTIPSRLENSWRASILPEKDDATGTWPDLAAAFTAEANVFSSYVNQRWGLSAGRVWGLRVR